MRVLESIVLEKSSERRVITIARLVKEVSDQLAYNRDAVIAEIIRLRAEGKILVIEPVPYRRLIDYLLSPASIWFWETTLATTLPLALVFISSGSLLYLRYVFGALLVLFLPGFSLVSVLYPKKDHLDYRTRIVISFVMSLAMVILIGLALNYTPFGITLPALVLSLSAATVALLFLKAVKSYAGYRLVRV